MVTHNPEIAKNAGEIIVLRDGQVIDRINQREGEQ
jgi:ABC-type lipoprotein export system ATPase subunit